MPRSTVAASACVNPSCRRPAPPARRAVPRMTGLVESCALHTSTTGIQRRSLAAALATSEAMKASTSMRRECIPESSASARSGSPAFTEAYSTMRPSTTSSSGLSQSAAAASAPTSHCRAASARTRLMMTPTARSTPRGSLAAATMAPSSSRCPNCARRFVSTSKNSSGADRSHFRPPPSLPLLPGWRRRSKEEEEGDDAGGGGGGRGDGDGGGGGDDGGALAPPWSSPLMLPDGGLACSRRSGNEEAHDGGRRWRGNLNDGGGGAGAAVRVTMKASASAAASTNAANAVNTAADAQPKRRHSFPPLRVWWWGYLLLLLLLLLLLPSSSSPIHQQPSSSGTEAAGDPGTGPRMQRRCTGICGLTISKRFEGSESG